MYAALEQTSNAGLTSRRSRNRAEFGHWPVVPADDDDVTLLDPIKIT